MPKPRALRRSLGLILLLGLLPLAVWLGWARTAFLGLSNPDALDIAQTARHLAEGDGFVTSAITPLTLGLVPRVEGHPVLLQAPLFTFYEALWFRVGGARPILAAAATGLLWLLSLWLTFACARRLFSHRAALFALLLFLTSAPLLRFSISGLPHLLAAATVTGLLMVLIRAGGGHPGRPTWGLPAAAGVLAGLACLTDHALTWMVVVPALLFWVRAPRQADAAAAPSHQAGRRAGLIFVVALALCLAPWMARNARVVGNPFWTPDRYELLVRTDEYPGQSVFRRLPGNIHGPLAFVVDHPLQTARKVARGLGELGETLPSVPGMVVLALFLAGCLRPPRDAAGRVQRYFLTMMLLGAGFHCLASQQFDRLLAFTPGMVLFASAAACRLVDELAERQATGRLAWARPLVPLAAVWLLTTAPLVSAWARTRAVPPVLPTAGAVHLAREMGQQEAVVTDAPWLIAWYVGRPAVWLPQEEKEFNKLVQNTRSLSWLYFSRYGQWIEPLEMGRWWRQAVVSRGGYGPFERQDAQAPREVILRRSATAAGTTPSSGH